MSSVLFISRVFIDIELAVQQAICLTTEISHHLVTVLRLKADDAVILFNGRGGEFVGRVLEANKKSARVFIDRFYDVNRESTLHVHLGQAISRGDRMDFSVQKAVELGVSEITPIISEHCQFKKNKTQWDKRLAHWQRIAISASEQCGRCVVPTIHPPDDFQQWIMSDFSGLKLICHVQQDQRFAAGLSNEHVEQVALLIGPESGFSDREFLRSQEHGFQSFDLGPRVLRTETATVVALALLQKG